MNPRRLDQALCQRLEFSVAKLAKTFGGLGFHGHAEPLDQFRYEVSGLLEPYEMQTAHCELLHQFTFYRAAVASRKYAFRNAIEARRGHEKA